MGGEQKERPAEQKEGPATERELKIALKWYKAGFQDGHAEGRAQVIEQARLIKQRRDAEHEAATEEALAREQRERAANETNEERRQRLQDWHGDPDRMGSDPRSFLTAEEHEAKAIAEKQEWAE